MRNSLMLIGHKYRPQPHALNRATLDHHLVRSNNDRQCLLAFAVESHSGWVDKPHISVAITQMSKQGFLPPPG